MSGMAHHKLGPSSSAKWLNCPGAPNAERGYDNTSNPAADEGSAAHQLGEWTLLSEEKRCEDFLGKLAYTGEDGTEYFVDEEMVYHVQDYVDYVMALVDKYNGELFVETKVNLGSIVPSVPYFVNNDGIPVYILEDGRYDPSCIFESKGQDTLGEEVIEVDGIVESVYYTEEGFGTSDAIVLGDGVLIVCDLKYGRGIEVSAFENPQGLFYAKGSYDEHSWLCEIKDVQIHIHQPRMDNISQYDISADDLNAWADGAHEAYLKTLPSDAPRIPGKKQCQWCLASVDCKPYIAMTFQDVVEDYADFDDSIQAVTHGKLVDDNKLSTEELAKVYERASEITDILNNIKAKLTQDAKDGVAIPGFKLVRGRGSRVYKDEKKALKAFTRKLGIEVVAPRKILTPPQMEKLKDKRGIKVKGSRLFNTHVNSQLGNLVLASSDDKRAEITVDRESDYEDFIDTP